MAPADPRTTASRVVVVAGMHRAGTSVVARGLQALGIDLGDALMSADARMNARGFFEDTDIVRQDDVVLDALGADWKSVDPLAAVDWEADALGQAYDDARRLLERKLARTGSFGFKDPRVPRLLPFWQHVFSQMGAEDGYVIAVRHPLAVVDSLTARDGLDPRRSAWLWVVHLLCALRHTRGRTRVVVDYDRMLADPSLELARIAKALAIPDAVLCGAEVASFAQEFVSGGLRHAQYASDDVAALRELPLVADAHLLAQRLARDDYDPGDATLLASADTLCERLDAFAPLLAYAGRVERAADQVPRLAGELAWAREALASATAYNEDLRATIAPKDAYVNDLVTTLERKETELVAAHALLERIGERALGRMLMRGIERKR